MSGYQSNIHRYREIAVQTASPLQLVVMLYDAAICCSQEALEKMNRKDIAGRAKAVNKCISIISELQACLDLQGGGEIANSLNRLYDYMKRRIFRASLEQSGQPLSEVKALLENLRSAWAEIAQQSATTSVPSITQSLPNAMNTSPAVSLKSLNISI
jgi:flagellar secretion chaperone FliS